ncbi:MAE_28990/MAE_18760 family HEPN-like nuclease [Pedobacter sp. BMA]|uniref:MAE_28990/MAE_18760 family HEPN-like nuclease n=1 Tax=Pedobacter sp. BMA TaxID=1663685 RepID=UPI00069F8CA8|nr:MAE_28990/MAE_18760 family HEPN-like nuclease [Pedobacter sp. BMA]
MNLRELEDLLIEDWTWRKKEISNLILIAESSGEEVVLKSIILLLYSHWEGYIKKSSRIYLKYICVNDCIISDLTDNFKAVALKGVTKVVVSSSQTLTLENEIAYIKKFSKIDAHKLNTHIAIDLENEKDSSIIDTNQNLNPAIFKNILNVIGLNYKTAYEAKEIYIQEQLLANRNSIGHGNKKLASDDDFSLEINKIKKLRDVIVSIVENVRDEIIEYCSNEYYLKENQAALPAFLEQKEIELVNAFNEIETRYTDA